MYYSHPTSQPDNTMNQGMPSSDTYYSHSTSLPMIPSTTSDMKSSQSQPSAPLPILSNPPLLSSGQVYDHQQHHQELASRDTSLCSVLSSVIDEDISSHASSSLSGNPSGGQEGYILQLQKQLEDSKQLQTQYYYRIEQLMSLVEKQTQRISELQEQLTNGGGDTGVSCLVNGSLQQQQQPAHSSSTYHHPIQHQQQQHQLQHHH